MLVPEFLYRVGNCSAKNAATGPKPNRIRALNTISAMITYTGSPVLSKYHAGMENIPKADAPSITTILLPILSPRNAAVTWIAAAIIPAMIMARIT